MLSLEIFTIIYLLCEILFRNSSVVRHIKDEYIFYFLKRENRVCVKLLGDGNKNVEQKSLKKTEHWHYKNKKSIFKNVKKGSERILRRKRRFLRKKYL